ncbi:MAG: hypothetical protein HY293_05605 [Planctomycetes bacterium]|nr:hypothetical protein [Planctomycetota bacterium]
METVECRFRLGRALGEASLAVILSLIAVALFAADLYPRLAKPPALFLPGAALGAVLLIVLTWRRWRTRYRVDGQGVEFRRSAGRVVMRLEWSEIDEVFLLGDTEFELRGGGRMIRFAGPYDDLYPAREASMPQLEGIREKLQARALRDGTLTFRMPGGRWKAHLAYLAAVLVLTGMTWFCLATLLERRIRGFSFVILFFAGSWLWGLRKRASGLGTRVTLRREGIEVRRLDGRDRIPWEDLERTEWNGRGGLDLSVGPGRLLSLPASLANLHLLEEFLQEGRRAVDS